MDASEWMRGHFNGSQSADYTEIHEFVVAEIPREGDRIPAGKKGMRVSFSPEHNHLLVHNVTQFVLAHDGNLIFSPTQIAGTCSICSQHGVRMVLSVHGGGRCSDCGRLLCPMHNGKVDGKSYCPDCAKAHQYDWVAPTVGFIAVAGGVLLVTGLMVGAFTADF